MNYRYYTSNDFALDERFQQWVLNPDKESKKFWNEWIFNHPEKQAEVAKAIEIIRLTGLSNDHKANTEFLLIWKELLANNQKTERKPAKKIIYKYAPIAAVFIGLLFLATFWLYYDLQDREFLQYRTDFGEIRAVNLPDGSKVTLNANSSLKVFDDWGQTGSRKVFLDGEAFFEIVKTPNQQKFIVTTPENVNVHVLGTEFNVNTRRKLTSVYLQSGEVSINSEYEEVILKPGELAEYDQKDKKVCIKQAISENKLAWKDNLFVFDDTPLYKIAWELEDNFGTKVTIADDSLALQKFTAKLPRANPDILLNVLSETLQINIVKKENEILIQP